MRIFKTQPLLNCKIQSLCFYDKALTEVVIELNVFNDCLFASSIFFTYTSNKSERIIKILMEVYKIKVRKIYYQKELKLIVNTLNHFSF